MVILANPDQGSVLLGLTRGEVAALLERGSIRSEDGAIVLVVDDSDEALVVTIAGAGAAADEGVPIEIQSDVWAAAAKAGN